MDKWGSGGREGQGRGGKSEGRLIAEMNATLPLHLHHPNEILSSPARARANQCSYQLSHRGRLAKLVAGKFMGVTHVFFLFLLYCNQGKKSASKKRASWLERKKGWKIIGPRSEKANQMKYTIKVNKSGALKHAGTNTLF